MGLRLSRWHAVWATLSTVSESTIDESPSNDMWRQMLRLPRIPYPLSTRGELGSRIQNEVDEAQWYSGGSRNVTNEIAFDNEAVRIRLAHQVGGVEEAIFLDFDPRPDAPNPTLSLIGRSALKPQHLPLALKYFRWFDSVLGGDGSDLRVEMFSDTWIGDWLYPSELVSEWEAHCEKAEWASVRVVTPRATLFAQFVVELPSEVDQSVSSVCTVAWSDSNSICSRSVGALATLGSLYLIGHEGDATRHLELTSKIYECMLRMPMRAA